MPIFRSIKDFTHDLVAHVLRPGAVAIDATVGNGHDTLMLARAVGPNGRVVGFDIQAEAIEATRQRLAEARLLDRVRLIQDSHERMADWMGPELGSDRVRVVLFNLGYLPGGDHALITRAETTLPALEAALKLLDNDGLLAVVAYPGHEGGRSEFEAVLSWATSLAPDSVQALRYEFLNPNEASPVLLALTPRTRR